MADTKISALTESTTPAVTDVLPLVVNPGGSPGTRKVKIANILSLAYPVGSVYVSVISTSPSTLFGFGTWSAFATGRVLVGIDAGQTEFDTVEETGGAKTHTLTTAEIPAHVHNQSRLPTATGAVVGHTVDTSMSGTPTTSGVDTGSTGGGGAHNNLQPYVVVYMWKRTA